MYICFKCTQFLKINAGISLSVPSPNFSKLWHVRKA